jgi:propanol-preferring alcohol dehydrogenase
MPAAMMTAMVLDAPGRALRQASLPVPEPRGQDILLRVSACAVCRSELI